VPRSGKLFLSEAALTALVCENNESVSPSVPYILHQLAKRRSRNMDIAYVSALSALAGSVIGGLTTGLTTWLSQRVHARAGLLAQNMSERVDLYRDFINAASKVYGKAIVSSEPKIEELVELYALVSRMRVRSLPLTVECADKVVQITIDTFFEPNKTIRELRDIIKSGGASIDPLREFSEAARQELRAFTTV
jgi:hypothetical protein